MLTNLAVPNIVYSRISLIIERAKSPKDGDAKPWVYSQYGHDRQVAEVACKRLEVTCLEAFNFWI
jgi:hypothetical protein